MLSPVRHFSTVSRRLLLALLLGLAGAGSTFAVLPTMAIAQSVATKAEPESPASPSPKSRVELHSELAWEYRPYHVVVWLVNDGSQVFRQVEDRIKKRIQRDAALDEYNGWQVRCERPTAMWNSRLSAAWDDKLADLTKPLADDSALRESDKLTVIRLSKSREGYVVQARELDLATKQWSSLTSFPVAELDLIPARAFAAMRRSFMPLTRIERVASEKVYVRTRASALSRRLEVDDTGAVSEVVNRESPLWVRDNDVLLPVLRRDASTSRSSSAEPIAWTYLSVEERLESTLKCQTHTAQMAPLSGRSGSTIKKYALVVRPEAKPTTLFVTSQESKTAAPISGLEIYSCSARELTANNFKIEGLGPDQLKLIGKTDWKGGITVAPAEDGSIRYIIVRNGKLATKKPILPGLQSSLTATVPSDRARIFAEGVVFGLRGEIIDFFAMRETTRVRIQLALEKKQFEKANKIWNEEFVKLISSRELGIRMSEIKERLMNRKDADIRQRSRIEMMFDDLDRAMATINGKLEDRDGSDLLNRVVNKISTPPPSKPSADGLPEAPEGAPPSGESPTPPESAPPSDAQPQPASTPPAAPATQGQDFD